MQIFKFALMAGYLSLWPNFGPSTQNKKTAFQSQDHLVSHIPFMNARSTFFEQYPRHFLSGTMYSISLVNLI